MDLPKFSGFLDTTFPCLKALQRNLIQNRDLLQGDSSSLSSSFLHFRTGIYTIANGMKVNIIDQARRDLLLNPVKQKYPISAIKTQM